MLILGTALLPTLQSKHEALSFKDA